MNVQQIQQANLAQAVVSTPNTASPGQAQVSGGALANAQGVLQGTDALFDVRLLPTGSLFDGIQVSLDLSPEAIDAARQAQGGAAVDFTASIPGALQEAALDIPDPARFEAYTQARLGDAALRGASGYGVGNTNPVAQQLDLVA